MVVVRLYVVCEIITFISSRVGWGKLNKKKEIDVS